MREIRSYGSVRGVAGNRYPYGNWCLWLREGARVPAWGGRGARVAPGGGAHGGKRLWWRGAGKETKGLSVTDSGERLAELRENALDLWEGL